jgi:hypothetical protein
MGGWAVSAEGRRRRPRGRADADGGTLGRGARRRAECGVRLTHSRGDRTDRRVAPRRSGRRVLPWRSHRRGSGAGHWCPSICLLDVRHGDRPAASDAGAMGSSAVSTTRPTFGPSGSTGPIGGRFSSVRSAPGDTIR